MKSSLLTIAAMLAIAYTSRFAGLDASMGLAFASTGALFAFFSPLLGWLGVALTGSDTSSNALFGNLQQITAQQAGLSPVLTTAANSSGGVMAKMIDAQSIVVAGVATGSRATRARSCATASGIGRARLPDGRAGVPPVQPALLDDPRITHPVARRGPLWNTRSLPDSWPLT